MREKFLLEAVNAPGTAVLFLDAALRVLDVTDGISGVTGLARGMVVGQLLDEVGPLAPIAARLREGVPETGHPGEITVVQNGNPVRLMYRAGKMTADTGEKPGYFLFLTDLTPVFRTFTGVGQAGKKASLITSIVRHDIQNQITALLGYLELSLDLVPEQEGEMKTFLERCLQAAVTIQRQVTYTREFKGLGVEEPVWLDIRTIISTVLDEQEMPQVSVINKAGQYEVYTDLTFGKTLAVFLNYSLTSGGPCSTIRFSTYEQEGGLVVAYEDDAATAGGETRTGPVLQKDRPYTLRPSDAKEVLALSGFTLLEKTVPGKGVRYEILVPPGSFRIAGQDT